MTLVRKAPAGVGPAAPPPAPVAPPPACTAQLDAFPAPEPPRPPGKRRKRASGAQASPEEAFLAKTDPANAPRPRSGGFGEARIQKAAAELDVIIASGDWSTARPIHFVAVYARMHKLVYGVDAVWTGEDRRRFAMVVGGVIRRDPFCGDPGKFADYMRWVWRREKRTEKWRRDTGNPGRVIGWQLQCSTKLINEYNVNVGARGRD